MHWFFSTEDVSFWCNYRQEEIFHRPNSRLCHHACFDHMVWPIIHRLTASLADNFHIQLLKKEPNIHLYYPLHISERHYAHLNDPHNYLATDNQPQLKNTPPWAQIVTGNEKLPIIIITATQRMQIIKKSFCSPSFILLFIHWNGLAVASSQLS